MRCRCARDQQDASLGAAWPHARPTAPTFASSILVAPPPQLRAVAKARCFLAPQGGASYLTFYQPGFHVVTDRTGKERCLSAQLASNGALGTYWHYYTALPGTSGESIIYNVAGNRSRLVAALDVMCRTTVCEVPPGTGDL